MFGSDHGVFSSGSGFTTVRGDVVEMHMGAFGIIGGILAIILWALVVAALVLAIITLVRRLREPRMRFAVPAGPMGPGLMTPDAAPLVLPGAGTTSMAGSAPVYENPPAGPAATTDQPAPAGNPLQVLEDRYARGEIGHDEYLERKRNLLGS
jgi:putative membrane protein